MDDFQKLNPYGTFQFACHPGISCFNNCCRDLNQFLTPYDILRLKNRLGVSSQQFLKEYTASHIGPRSGLPVVSLKMSAEQPDCPFVSPTGCTVYEDRPGACRTYPLGRVAARKRGDKACGESYFLIREAHCLGFGEPKKWTVEKWKKDQDLETYNEMNDLMMDILSSKNQSGKKQLTGEEADLFFMACYDLDRFKDFVSDDDISKAYSTGEGTKKTILRDDVAFMRFAIKWIKLKLFGNL